MILRTRPHLRTDGPALPGWQFFLQTQQHAERPAAVVYQSEHSSLAGQLAGWLSEDAFGALPWEVIEAARRHDFGWDESDERQLTRAAEAPPKSFTAIPVEETLVSWRASIDEAGASRLLVQSLVSRHFTTLAGSDAQRAGFVREETARRAGIEPALSYSTEQLDRWTDAVGFCDLVSLCLCCGAEATVKLPLAHPASSRAAAARKVEFSWAGGVLRFSAPVLRAELRLERSGARRAQEIEVASLRLREG